MPEEKTTESASSEESVVTDASLDSAAEESTNTETPKETDLGAEAPAETSVVETPKAPTEKVVDTENAERSKLGRKFATLEGENKALKERLDAIEQRSQEPPSSDSEEDFIYPTTKTELHEQFRDFQKQESQAQAKARKGYEESYLGTLSKLSENSDEKEHEAILGEMSKPGSKFNLKHSNNGSYDAEKNYLRAQNHILSEKLKTAASPTPPENPLKGEEPSGPLGVGGESKVVSKQVKPVKLDAYAQEFKEKMGMSDEDVADALSGDEMPSMQRGM